MAASQVHATEQLLFHTLLQLAIIVLAARAGGRLAQRWGQSAAVGEIITGILLGPSLFGALAPELFKLVFRSAAPLLRRGLPELQPAVAVARAARAG